MAKGTGGCVQGKARAKARAKARSADASVGPLGPPIRASQRRRYAAEAERAHNAELARLCVLNRPLYDFGQPDLLIDHRFVNDLHFSILLGLATQHEPKAPDWETMIAHAYAWIGAEVEEPASGTNPAFDLIVNGHRLSIKSEQAQTMVEGWGRISKLMGAAWISGLRSRRGAWQAREEIIASLDMVDDILFARTFKDTEAGTLRFDLHAIPVKTLRDGIERLRERDFRHQINSKSWFMHITDDNGEPFCTLYYDASGRKIEIRNLNMDLAPRIVTMHIDHYLNGPDETAED